MDSDHSGMNGSKSTSSGSDRQGSGLDEIVRDFTAGLARTGAGSSNDTMGMVSPELARIFDHLRHVAAHDFDHLLTPVTIGGVVCNRPPPSQDPPPLVWPTTAQASATWTMTTATAGQPATDGVDQTPSLSGSGSRDQRPEVQVELDQVRGRATTTLGRLLFETPPVQADQTAAPPDAQQTGTQGSIQIECSGTVRVDRPLPPVGYQVTEPDQQQAP